MRYSTVSYTATTMAALGPELLAVMVPLTPLQEPLAVLSTVRLATAGVGVAVLVGVFVGVFVAVLVGVAVGS
jgi:integral membrane sensor domain MASE1